MAHRVATDEICVKRGMGKSPSSGRRELVRVPACCLLAPKDLACHNMLDPCKKSSQSVILCEKPPECPEDGTPDGFSVRSLTAYFMVKKEDSIFMFFCLSSIEG